jgi:N-acetylmuramoyl-L-alanine amidase
MSYTQNHHGQHTLRCRGGFYMECDGNNSLLNGLSMIVRLAYDRFASEAASQKAKRSGFLMKNREARTRFYFFCNTLFLYVFVLLGTPTGAKAPTLPTPMVHKETHTVSSIHSGIAKQATTEAPRKTKREHIQVSRDQQLIAARVGRHKLSTRDIELLARLVYAEGRGEPYAGQVAIAAVVLNRLESPDFPDTVREVIFAPNAFSPAKDGKLPQKTNKTARQAVLDAINGKDPSKGSLYFFNPNTSTSDWIWSRPQTVRIANHVFAR